MRSPTRKATTIDRKIPDITLTADSTLIAVKASARVPVLTQASARAAPNNSKITVTVVDVGKPNVEKRSNITISVSATAVNKMIASFNVKNSG